MRKLIIILALLGLSISAFAQENPFSFSQGSVSEYSEDELFDVCFFGDGARWNGYEVTVQDYLGKLTEEQRAMFVVEAVVEIGKNTSTFAQYPSLGQLLMSVSKEATYFLNKSPEDEMLMIKFLQDFFESNGMMKTW